MSKKGTYHGPFFNSFAARIRGTQIRFGVLIGTLLDEDGQRDALFAAPTPPGGDEAPAQDVAALLKSTAGDLPFADWAVQHMEAVRKLLPGGLEPCGCFAVASESAAKDLAPSLVPVLKGIKDPLVLTIDPSSAKTSFWQHSGGGKPALRPAQMKADPHKEALLLWAAWPLDVVMPRSGKCVGEDADVEAVVAEAEASFAASLAGCAVGVADGSGGPMRAVDFSSDAAIAASVPKGCNELRVAFLRSGTALHALPNPEGKPCVRQRCLIVATAVVLNRKMETRQAMDMLRKSLAASAAGRLQQALEEAEGAESSVQLPHRVLRRPGDLELPAYCGDYCMPDEEASAAEERLAQLLGAPQEGLQPPPEHLDEWARLSRDFQGTYTAAPQQEAAVVGSKQAAKSGSSMLPIVAVVMAIVAVLLAMLLK